MCNARPRLIDILCMLVGECLQMSLWVCAKCKATLEDEERKGISEPSFLVSICNRCVLLRVVNCESWCPSCQIVEQCLSVCHSMQQVDVGFGNFLASNK